MYRADNSGTHATPYPGTNVEARNRVDHRTFIWFHKFLIGTGFAPLCQRFERGLARHLLPFQSTRMRDWVHGDDLMQMFKQSLLSPAVTDAIFGRTLLDRHPHVLEEIWRLDDNLWRLGSRLPKFIFPGAHNTLRKCTAAVKDWHAYAMTQAKSSGPREISENEDAFFSSEFVQSRREFFQTIDGQDEGSMISEDVALLWAYVQTPRSILKYAANHLPGATTTRPSPYSGSSWTSSALPQSSPTFAAKPKPASSRTHQTLPQSLT